MLDQNYNQSNINPYFTTYGKLIPLANLEESLLRLTVNLIDRRSLSYGINLGKFIPVVITGKNEAERSIPVFAYPYIFKGTRGDEYIAIDVREFVSPNKLTEGMSSYQDLLNVTPREDNIKLLFRCAKIMSTMIEGSLGILPKDEFMIIYSLIFSNLTNRLISLSFAEQSDVKAIVTLFAYFLMTNDLPQDVDTSMLATKVLNVVKIPNFNIDDSKEVMTIFTATTSNLLEVERRKLSTLLTCCIKVLPDDKHRFFKDALFINSGKNLWFGPGKHLALTIGLENVPVLLSTIELAMSGRTFKNSGLTNMLSKYNKLFNQNEFIKNLERNFNYLKG